MKTQRGFGGLAALACLLLGGCEEPNYYENCSVLPTYEQPAEVNNGRWFSTSLRTYQPDYGDVQLAGDNKGVAIVGSNYNGSSFFQTADNGAHWTNLAPANAFGNFQFVDASTGYMRAMPFGGDSTLLFKTTNGGAAWALVNTGTNRLISALEFVSPSTGWIGDFDGIIRKTTDGGNTWKAQATAPTYSIPVHSKTVQSLDFVDPDFGWAVGTTNSLGFVLSTTNGGQNWKEKPVPFDGDLYTVGFKNRTTGWVGGDYGLAKTTDGGATWTRDSSGLPAVPVFLNEYQGFAFQSLKAVKTTDGGATWTPLPLPTLRWITSLRFLDAQNGWLATDGGLYRTNDGGATWTQTTLLAGAYQPLDGTTGWMTTRGAFLKTTNGGVSWTTHLGSLTMRDLHFATGTLGWGVGENGLTVRTTNGGMNWEVPPSVTSRNLKSVHFVDAVNGWAAGDGGTVLKTANAGVSWTSVYSSGPDSLRAVRFVNASTGWVVGAGGLIRKTTDGGSSWTTQPSPTTQDLFAIEMVGTSLGYITGAQGVVLKTTDGGASWLSLNPGTLFPLYGVSFVDANIGYVVGGGRTAKIPVVDTSMPSMRTAKAVFGGRLGEALDATLRRELGLDALQERLAGGMHGPECPTDPGAPYYRTILRTTDGGATWTPEKSGEGRPWLSVDCDASGKCIALGDDGVWRR